MLQKENIKLRAPEPEDLEFLYKWENDTDIWQVSNTLAPYSKHILRQHIEDSGKSIYETFQQRFMIEVLDLHLPVGTIDIFDFDPLNQRAGIGILIASEENRRKGYARLALECLIEYCFSRLKLHQLHCNISKDNKASISLFTGMGFSQSGIKKDWMRSESGFTDELFFQLINPAPMIDLK